MRTVKRYWLSFIGYWLSLDNSEIVNKKTREQENKKIFNYEL